MKIACPQCGAEFGLTEPRLYVVCKFCQNYLFIDLDKITAVYSFTPTVEPQQVSQYLKRDFAKLGFAQEIRVVQILPVLFPFWKIEGRTRWTHASAEFPGQSILPVTSSPVFFDSQDIDFRIRVYDVDLQPPGSSGRVLYYCPFFQVEVEFRGHRYTFFVSGLSGEVFGEPIPYMSGDSTGHLFPLFVFIFVTFFVINTFFDHLWISIACNGAAFYLFYQLAYGLIQKEGIKP